MAYQFTQTGQEIQDILNQVGDNTSDISSLDTRLTTAEGDIDAAQEDISSLNLSLTQTNTAISSTTGGVPVRKVGSLSAGASTTISFAADYSVLTEFALVCLNIDGNGAGGAELLFLGKGTGKYKALIGAMSSSYYSLAYRNNTWTITNASPSPMFYTAIVTK